MTEKIRPDHLRRTAYVYVRQSSAHQVRHHRESRQRQYALADRARALGFAETVVIDEDQGKSGSGKQARSGFGHLLTAVCQGQAGAVFALEASRLARNNRDWYHLIDLCALTDTLILDGDGVYDPRGLNDRLLLGLKGSMAEFELGLLRQRAREAFEQKIQRGHALWELPVGFVRTEEDLVEKIADRQVQEAIASVFRKFREFGSVRQTTLWYHDQRIPLPHVRPGTGSSDIIWQLPTGHRLYQIVKNPIYAGALAYGRTAAKTVVEDQRVRTASTRRRKPPEEWTILIRDKQVSMLSRAPDRGKSSSAAGGESVHSGAGVDLYVRWSNVAADPNVTSGERTYRQGSDRPCAGLRWPRTANPAFGQSLTCRARSLTLILCGGLRESGQSSTSRS